MENANEVIHCDEPGFDRLINGATKPVLIDFWATWCGPCRAIGPLLEKLAREHGTDVIVAKVNVDDCPALAQQFNITAIPTLLFFKEGTIVDTVRGLVGYDMLVAKVKSIQ
ncbi:MAG TPA: thioredoxin [Opitutales bacterium]|nr:thioredoxin [Opitutales bacterium]